MFIEHPTMYFIDCPISKCIIFMHAPDDASRVNLASRARFMDMRRRRRRRHFAFVVARFALWMHRRKMSLALLYFFVIKLAKVCDLMDE